MRQERMVILEGKHTGGQRPPQLTTNLRSADGHAEKRHMEKRREILKSRVARMRIENDLYERQNS